MSGAPRIDTLIGPSPWVVVDQAMIDAFGKVTRDPDPMHDDPEWARANSPFGGTIAYGFLTMSLLSHLLRATLERDRVLSGAYVNYGFDRLRLVEPVVVGARVRGTFRVADVTTQGGRERLTLAATVEIEGKERPALAGDWLTVRIA